MHWLALSLICAFALVPGLPKLPFLLIGAALAGISYAIKDGLPAGFGQAAEPKADAAPELPPGPDPATEALQVDPLELAIGFGLVPLVDQGQGAGLIARISAIRRQLAGELGTVVPPVRIHDELALDSHEATGMIATEVGGRAARVAAGRRMLDGTGKRDRECPHQPHFLGPRRATRPQQRRRRALRRGDGTHRRSVPNELEPAH